MDTFLILLLKHTKLFFANKENLGILKKIKIYREKLGLYF